MHLVVNAWPLCVTPHSALAFHLRELIQELLALDEELRVTLVGPGSNKVSAPERVEYVAAELPVGPWGRLRFEQRALPRLAGQLGAELVFNLEASAPLRSPAPVVALAQRPSLPLDEGLLARLRRAFGSAGLTGAAARLRWADEPEALAADERALAPSVSAAFRATDPGDDSRVRSSLRLPPGYVLCLGPRRYELPLILAAWSWVDASVGDAFPLVMAGLSPKGREYAEQRAEELNLGDSVFLAEHVMLEQLPAIFRGAEALLHSGASVTGQELRWALATGTPIACGDSEFAASVAGEAAYLAPRDNTRSLGAACVTLLVEREQVAKPLREKGLMRAGGYHGAEPRANLLAALRSALEQVR